MIGIFQNSDAQDTLEYVAAGFIAVAVSGIIISILKPIFLDCMIVDAC